MKTKLNTKILVLIFVVSIVLACIYNAFSVNGIPFIREPLIVKTTNIDSSTNSTNELKGLQLAKVLELFNQDAAIFIDARDQWEYAENHITGAINIPEFSFTSENKTLTSISKESLIVVYCDGDDCDISKRLANELVKIGYKNIYVFLGGFNEWLEAKLPAESGESL